MTKNMDNYTSEKVAKELRKLLDGNKISVTKESGIITIKQPKTKAITVNDRPVQLDSTELI